VNGFEHIHAFLSDEEQFELTAALRRATALAPLFEPRFRSGLPYRMKVTNAGKVGFVGSQTAEQFSPHHPVTGKPWPDIPAIALDISRRLAGDRFYPDNVQISLYQHPADGDGIGLEAGAEAGSPLLLIALGDSMIFRLGGQLRADPLRNYILRTGDVVILKDDALRAWHGREGLQSNSCRLPLLSQGGHICLALRRTGVLPSLSGRGSMTNPAETIRKSRISKNVGRRFASKPVPA